MYLLVQKYKKYHGPKRRSTQLLTTRNDRKNIRYYDLEVKSHFWYVYFICLQLEDVLC